MRTRAFAVVLALVYSVALAYAQESEPQRPAAPPETTAPTATEQEAAVAPVPAPTPTPTAPAPTRITTGSKLFIEDTSEFGMALAAAFIDKKVPVVVVTDPAKADFIVRAVSQDRKASTAAKLFGVGRDRYHATVSVVNRDGVVVFAYNVKKNTFQDAANSTANEVKKKQIGGN